MVKQAQKGNKSNRPQGKKGLGGFVKWGRGDRTGITGNRTGGRKAKEAASFLPIAGSSAR